MRDSKKLSNTTPIARVLVVDDETAIRDTLKNILETEYNKPSKEELKEKLTALQYEVTQNAKTERPYQNDYDDLFLMFCVDVKNRKIKFYPQKLVRVDIDKYFRIVEKYRTISKEIEGVLKRSGLII